MFVSGSCILASAFILWRFRASKCGAHEDTYLAACLWTAIAAAWWLWTYGLSVIAFLIASAGCWLLWQGGLSAAVAKLFRRRRRRRP